MQRTRPNTRTASRRRRQRRNPTRLRRIRAIRRGAGVHLSIPPTVHPLARLSVPSHR